MPETAREQAKRLAAEKMKADAEKAKRDAEKAKAEQQISNS